MYRELYYTLMVSVIAQVETRIIAIAGNVTCLEQVSRTLLFTLQLACLIY